ncbi:MAG TPA: hypothetical protein VHZ55_28575 [Bryobacteraceae bacterium]|nr:hypothetical protein [Bryobacteraceae bacterium]
MPADVGVNSALHGGLLVASSSGKSDLGYGPVAYLISPSISSSDLAGSFLLLRREPACLNLALWPMAEVVVWVVFLVATLDRYLQSQITDGFTMRYPLRIVFPFGVAIA